MHVTLYKRMRGGWATIESDMPPLEVKAFRRQWKKKLAARDPDKRLGAFHVTKVGEIIYGSCSGTCTELTAAGVCVACLHREPNCTFCGGTGEFLLPGSLVKVTSGPQAGWTGVLLSEDGENAKVAFRGYGDFIFPLKDIVNVPTSA